MYGLFARVRFGRKFGTVDFAVSTPANPARHQIDLFARSKDSGPDGWARLASFYTLDLANAFWLAGKAVRGVARGRRVYWWNGRAFRGKKPMCRGLPSWSYRLRHAQSPLKVGKRRLFLKKDCPF